MAKKIETSLNWPEEGLTGVPDSEGPLTYTPPPANEPTQDDAPGPEAAAEGNGTTTAGTATAGAASAASAASAVPSIGQAVRELTHLLEKARAEGDADTVREAEDSLARIRAASVDVSMTLERISGLLSERGGRLTTQLDFGTNPLADDDPALLNQSLFGDRVDGFAAMGDVTPAQTSGITWPPWGPTRKRSVWSRLQRSNIAIPLLLLAVIAVAAATYKVYKHETRATIVPAVTANGISANGSVKVVDGPACRAGSSTTTVQLDAAQTATGSFYIAATGSVTNGGSAALHHLSVHVRITYADGAQTDESMPANTGKDIPGKSTKSWFGSAVYTDGSVPPVGVAITHLTGSPALPACA